MIRAKSVVLLALTAVLGLTFAVRADEPVAEQSTSDAPSAPAKGEKMQVAVIETTEGEITVRLLPDVAPKAVENFVGLSKRGYYEGVVFHRVIKDFMIQGGDPTGTGYGGKSIWEIPFEDETDPSWRFDRKGLLAMANTGRPKTNGSQFFITLGETSWLNDKHTIFGEVIGGMDVVDEIGQVETNPQDRPVVDIKISAVRIEERTAQ